MPTFLVRLAIINSVQHKNTAKSGERRPPLAHCLDPVVARACVCVCVRVRVRACAGSLVKGCGWIPSSMAASLPGGWFESGHGSITVFVKDFRDPLQRRKKLILKPWASIKDIKDQLQIVFNVPTNAQKLFFKGRELKNVHNLQECGIYFDNAVVDFVARRPQNLAMMYATTADVQIQQEKLGNKQGSAKPTRTQSSGVAKVEGSASVGRHTSPVSVMSIHPYGAHVLPVSLLKILHQALQGLALGLAPTLSMDGTGGTYFLRDPSHRNVGCFKPQDEEPFGPNNPRGLVGELGQSGLRRGILSGEACERELAAYLLDKDHFAGVPATALVEARHPAFKYGESSVHLHFKMGSLQEFVRHDDVVSDLAPNQFSTHQVHKIVLLDMRLLNTDRNDANILVRKRRSATTNQVEYELIPIDHGYCLPQYLEIAWCDWCWFNWPQLQRPLSKEDREYVLSLNPTTDAESLSKKIPLRRACRRNMIIAGMVVQKGVRSNLTLFEIANIMCREDLDAPSLLEKLCLDAFNQVVRHRRSPTERAPSANARHAAGTEQCTENGNHNGVDTNSPQQPPNANRSSFKLEMSVDIPPSPTTFEDCNSPKQSGARSPPGFWASYTPFRWCDDDLDEEEGADEKGSENSPPRDSAQSWDQTASKALMGAVNAIEKQDLLPTQSENSSVSSKSLRSSQQWGAFLSTGNSSFGTESEKDDFEALNDMLDDNLQEEKLFLAILGKLLDEHIAQISEKEQANVSRSNRN